MVVVERDNCKGCGRCVAACPKKCLEIGEELNSMGIKAVKYRGEGCISCGICFYNCPEPYALRVVKSDERTGNGERGTGERKE